MDSSVCYNCENPVEFEQGKSLTRYEECEKCSASMRCCRMCAFYDTSSYNECREPMATRIVDKEKANFCEFYKFTGAEKNSQSKSDMLSAADALFKD